MSVTMKLPDGKGGFVTEQVNESDVGLMSRAGGTIVKPLTSFQQTAKRYLDMAPTAGAVTGSIGGGMAAPAANAALTGFFPPAAANLPAAPMEGREIGGVAGGVLGKLIQEGGYRLAGMGDAPGTVGDEAKRQALLGMAGEGIGLVGQGLGRTAIAGSLASRGRQLAQATGEMVRERLPVGGFNIAPALSKLPIVGPMLTRGSKAAGSNFVTKLAARDAVNAAGPSIPAQGLENEFANMGSEAMGRSDKSSQLAALNKRYSDFLDTWQTGRLSASDAQQYLTSLGEEAKPLYEAAGQRGVRIPPADQIVAQQAKRLYGSLQKTMATLVNGHAATNKALSSAIAARDAIAASEAMPGVARIVARSGVGTTLGGAAGALSNQDHLGGAARGSAIGLAAANSPEILSRTGLAITDPVIQALLRQTPRFVLNK